MKLLNCAMNALTIVFMVITIVVVAIPYGLAMLFAYLEELTDK